jgi:hypothetical protein
MPLVPTFLPRLLEEAYMRTLSLAVSGWKAVYRKKMRRRKKRLLLWPTWPDEWAILPDNNVLTAPSN